MTDPVEKKAVKKEKLPYNCLTFNCYATPWEQLKMMFRCKTDEERRAFYGPFVEKPAHEEPEKKPLEVRYYQAYTYPPTTKKRDRK